MALTRVTEAGRSQDVAPGYCRHSAGKRVFPPSCKKGGNLLPAVLPLKPGKQHGAWLVKKGQAHISETFIVCLD